MAKKNNSFGKLLAFTTTVAAIGGTCYIFRDKIKQSALYKASVKTFSNIFGNIPNKFQKPLEDDFYFDDEDIDFDDVFTESAEHGREYTSITINAHDDKDSPATEPASSEDTTSAQSFASDSTAEQPSVKESVSPESVIKPVPDTDTIPSGTDSANSSSSPEDVIELFAEEPVPTIAFHSVTGKIDTSSDNSSSTATAYENEGLSDVSEDPYVLEEQDKLDF